MLGVSKRRRALGTCRARRDVSAGHAWRAETGETGAVRSCLHPVASPAPRVVPTAVRSCRCGACCVWRGVLRVARGAFCVQHSVELVATSLAYPSARTALPRFEPHLTAHVRCNTSPTQKPRDLYTIAPHTGAHGSDTPGDRNMLQRCTQFESRIPASCGPRSRPARRPPIYVARHNRSPRGTAHARHHSALLRRSPPGTPHTSHMRHASSHACVCHRLGAGGRSSRPLQPPRRLAPRRPARPAAQFHS